MAYVKPGVEITQVARSFSPSLIAPDLGAVLVAPVYTVVPMEGDGSYTYSLPVYTSGIAQTISLSGLSSDMYLDKDSVYVDLVKTTGTITGRVHLDNSDLTVTDGGTSIIISATQSAAAYALNGAQIRIGYRAMKRNVTGFLTFESQYDIDTQFGGGQTVYDNPLPFSLSLALNNTASQVFGYAIKYDEYASLAGSGTAATEHALARNVLENNEVYALAPYTNDSAIIASYTAHCNSLSAPTEKHERIVVASPEITFYDANEAGVGDSSLANKSTTARKIRDAAATVLDKRTFYIRPDVAYFKVNQVQVQKLKESYLGTTYELGENIYAKLANPVTLTLSTGATQYYAAGTEITDAVYANLKDSQNAYKFDALIPLPGFYLAACVAGQISGNPPEQGFTNLPIAGPNALKYATDFFSESNLNTIAEGGNYQFITIGGSISSRHQLSTNMNSVELRELSITKTVDYVAKYIRNALVGFIGRSLITPGFLSVVGAIINGLGSTLVKNGQLNGFKLNGVIQDPVQKDVVRVSLEILPKYPVNYIKVDLIF